MGEKIANFFKKIRKNLHNIKKEIIENWDRDYKEQLRDINRIGREFLRFTCDILLLLCY